MAHQIETMIFKGATPWHGLGVQVHGNLTSEEAIKQAGLDWRVKCNPLVAQTEAGDLLKTPLFGITRETDGQVYGAVRGKYEPLQNREAFKFFDPFVDSGEATYETAGSLIKGKRVWVLAKLNKAPIEVVKDDFVEKFLLLSNGHDGITSVRVGFTPVRVVCANTLAMAENENGGSQLLRVQHSGKMAVTMEKIQEITSAANAQFEATAEQYKYLARRAVNSSDLERFVKEVFFSRYPDETTQRMETRMAKIQDDITRLFEAGKGAEYHRGTAWGLYNATTEYLSYEKGKDEESRLNSLWFGQNAAISKKAFEFAKVV